jgi:hypothetical protein
MRDFGLDIHRREASIIAFFRQELTLNGGLNVEEWDQMTRQ